MVRTDVVIILQEIWNKNITKLYKNSLFYFARMLSEADKGGYFLWNEKTVRG